MTIGICDDDRIWCEKAEVLLSEYMKTFTENMRILTFHTRQELMAYEGEPLEVIFMDIVLEPKEGAAEEENGIRVTAWLNQKWKNCQVVYLTNYLYYATDVYQTEHAFFVLKEQFERRIPEVFDKILHNLEQSRQKYLFQTIGGKEISLVPEDIRYFERSKRVTRIVTVWGDYETWEKIADISAKLPGLDFVRCHNSYIVYLPAVRELAKDEIILEDGMKVPVSRSYRKNVKQAFARWMVTQMP